MRGIVMLMLCGLTALPVGNAQRLFVLRSPDFRPGGALSLVNEFHGPYGGCHGNNRAPALDWSGAPAGTRSFSFLIVDPDAPAPHGFVHRVVYNIPASSHELRTIAPAGAVEGTTGFGTRGYSGPCPPRRDRPHHYHFTLYALDVARLAGQGLTRDALLRAVQGHVLGTATLVGTYRRP